MRQLTNYRAHSNRSYFTYPCWYGQVFIVDVPAWDAMPDRSAVTRSKEV